MVRTRNASCPKNPRYRPQQTAPRKRKIETEGAKKPEDQNEKNTSATPVGRSTLKESENDAPKSGVSASKASEQNIANTQDSNTEDCPEEKALLSKIKVEDVEKIEQAKKGVRTTPVKKSTADECQNDVPKSSVSANYANVKTSTSKIIKEVLISEQKNGKDASATSNKKRTLNENENDTLKSSISASNASELKFASTIEIKTEASSEEKILMSRIQTEDIKKTEEQTNNDASTTLVDKRASNERQVNASKSTISVSKASEQKIASTKEIKTEAIPEDEILMSKLQTYDIIKTEEQTKKDTSATLVETSTNDECQENTPVSVSKDSEQNIANTKELKTEASPEGKTLMSKIKKKDLKKSVEQTKKDASATLVRKSTSDEGQENAVKSSVSVCSATEQKIVSIKVSNTETFSKENTLLSITRKEDKKKSEEQTENDFRSTPAITNTTNESKKDLISSRDLKKETNPDEKTLMSEKDKISQVQVDASSAQTDDIICLSDDSDIDEKTKQSTTKTQKDCTVEREKKSSDVSIQQPKKDDNTIKENSISKQRHSSIANSIDKNQKTQTTNVKNSEEKTTSKATCGKTSAPKKITVSVKGKKEVINLPLDLSNVPYIPHEVINRDVTINSDFKHEFFTKEEKNFLKWKITEGWSLKVAQEVVRKSREFEEKQKEITKKENPLPKRQKSFEDIRTPTSVKESKKNQFSDTTIENKVHAAQNLQNITSEEKNASKAVAKTTKSQMVLSSSSKKIIVCVKGKTEEITLPLDYSKDPFIPHDRVYRDVTKNSGFKHEFFTKEEKNFLKWKLTQGWTLEKAQEVVKMSRDIENKQKERKRKEMPSPKRQKLSEDDRSITNVKESEKDIKEFDKKTSERSKQNSSIKRDFQTMSSKESEEKTPAKTKNQTVLSTSPKKITVSFKGKTEEITLPLDFSKDPIIPEGVVKRDVTRNSEFQHEYYTSDEKNFLKWKLTQGWPLAKAQEIVKMSRDIENKEKERRRKDMPSPKRQKISEDDISTTNVKEKESEKKIEEFAKKNAEKSKSSSLAKHEPQKKSLKGFEENKNSHTSSENKTLTPLTKRVTVYFKGKAEEITLPLDYSKNPFIPQNVVKRDVTRNSEFQHEYYTSDEKDFLKWKLTQGWPLAKAQEVVKMSRDIENKQKESKRKQLLSDYIMMKISEKNKVSNVATRYAVQNELTRCRKRVLVSFKGKTEAIYLPLDFSNVPFVRYDIKFGNLTLNSKCQRETYSREEKLFMRWKITEGWPLEKAQKIVKMSRDIEKQQKQIPQTSNEMPSLKRHPLITTHTSNSQKECMTIEQNQSNKSQVVASAKNNSNSEQPKSFKPVIFKYIYTSSKSKINNQVSTDTSQKEVPLTKETPPLKTPELKLETTTQTQNFQNNPNVSTSNSQNECTNADKTRPSTSSSSQKAEPSTKSNPEQTKPSKPEQTKPCKPVIFKYIYTSSKPKINNAASAGLSHPNSVIASNKSTANAQTKITVTFGNKTEEITLPLDFSNVPYVDNDINNAYVTLNSQFQHEFYTRSEKKFMRWKIANGWTLQKAQEVVKMSRDISKNQFDDPSKEKPSSEKYSNDKKILEDSSSGFPPDVKKSIENWRAQHPPTAPKPVIQNALAKIHQLKSNAIQSSTPAMNPENNVANQANITSSNSSETRITVSVNNKIEEMTLPIDFKNVPFMKYDPKYGNIALNSQLVHEYYTREEKQFLRWKIASGWTLHKAQEIVKMSRNVASKQTVDSTPSKESPNTTIVNELSKQNMNPETIKRNSKKCAVRIYKNLLSRGMDKDEAKKISAEEAEKKWGVRPEFSTDNANYTNFKQNLELAKELSTNTNYNTTDTSQLNTFFKNESTLNTQTSSSTQMQKEFIKKPSIPCRIAIVDIQHPIKELSETQTEEIKKSLLNEVDNVENINDNLGFLGCEEKNGGLVLICNNDETKNWLHNVIGTLRPFEKGSLKIIEESGLERYLCFAHISAKDKIPFSQLLSRLEKQNAGLLTKSWHLIQTVATPNGGENLFFSVDEMSKQKIIDENGKLFLNFGRLNIKMKDKDGKTDIVMVPENLIEDTIATTVEALLDEQLMELDSDTDSSDSLPPAPPPPKLLPDSFYSDEDDLEKNTSNHSTRSQAESEKELKNANNSNDLLQAPPPPKWQTDFSNANNKNRAEIGASKIPTIQNLTVTGTKQIVQRNTKKDFIPMQNQNESIQQNLWPENEYQNSIGNYSNLAPAQPSMINSFIQNSNFSRIPTVENFNVTNPMVPVENYGVPNIDNDNQALFSDETNWHGDGRNLYPATMAYSQHNQWNAVRPRFNGSRFGFNPNFPPNNNSPLTYRYPSIRGGIRNSTHPYKWSKPENS